MSKLILSGSDVVVTLEAEPYKRWFDVEIAVTYPVRARTRWERLLRRKAPMETAKYRFAGQQPIERVVHDGLRPSGTNI